MSDSPTPGREGGEPPDPEQPDPHRPAAPRPGQDPPYDQPYRQPPYGPYDQGQYDQGQYGQQPYGYQQPGYYGGYQQPGGYYGGYPPPANHPQSTLALTLGLVGLVGTMLCLLPAVVGPFAWYVGGKAKNEIDASGGQLGGRGPAVAGYVLGIITTVLLALVVLGVATLIAVGVAGGFDDPGSVSY